MPKYFLSEINIYPIKSLGGISLKSSKIESRGLQYDRRWMLIDENNEFMSQRKFSEMSLLKVQVFANGISINHKQKNFDSLFIPFNLYDDESSIEVKIWDDIVSASLVSNSADCWFSKVLRTPCRLIYMPDNSIRNVDMKYAQQNEIVSFADGYPFLLIGQASLDELNSKLEIPVPMNRFRPNLVFTGGNSFDEDKWKKFKISETIFNVVKPCARCTIPTVDQETGIQNSEPLKTLAKFRTVNNKVLFGQNLLHEGFGEINLGDEVEVLEWK